MNYMSTRLVHINGGKGGAFNVPWEMWQASLGLSPSLGLAFRFLVACSLLLLCVREGDGDTSIGR